MTSWIQVLAKLAAKGDFGQLHRTGTSPSIVGRKLSRSRLLAQNKVARITESVAAFYGALLATTPMLATVSPFFIEGTAQTYRTTPLDGASASHTVLPNRSVT